MTDIFDRAQQLEELERDDALARQREKSSRHDPAQWEKLSAKWCEGHRCGARIPDERRRAIPGVQLCVECQAREEQRGRQYR